MKRLFRGLRDREPAKSYDAVVIGAGVGGLITANLLAREGLAVLLVEQHYMAGGYCSTFRRSGYTFDAATHFYPLLGNTDTLTGRLLVDLGVRTGWVKMDPVDTFHLPDGTRFEVPADLETYRRRLDREFPDEKQALDQFFESVREAYLHGLLYYFKGRETQRFSYYRDWTVRDAIDRFFHNEKLKLILTADCAHWGSRPASTSFVFDSMLRLSYFLGNYYPELGSQAFADDLARCFEENGGDILMSTEVEKILVENGAATGVVANTTRGKLTGRRVIGASTVVSNADLRLTFEQLLPAGSVPPDLTETVDGLRASFPCFLTHIGLRDVATEDLERVQGYYWNEWDPDLVGRNGLRCKIFSPTVYEPRMAPEGGQVVILQKVLEMDYDAIEDWPAHKAEIEDYIVGHFASVLPGVRDKMVVCLSASAKTSARFTLNTNGAMLGWEMSPEQLGAHRPGIESPVHNLYLTGHWSRPGGGITPVIISAIQAASAITGSSAYLPSMSSMSRFPDPHLLASAI